MERGVRLSLYVEDMIATEHDAANRAGREATWARCDECRRARSALEQKAGRKDYEAREWMREHAGEKCRLGGAIAISSS
jgi:hypothetical protein